MTNLFTQLVSEKNSKSSINSLFDKVLKSQDIKLTKFELQQQLLPLVYEQKFKKPITTEMINKPTVELVEECKKLMVTIGNSIDTAKSNSTTKKYYNKDFKKLLKLEGDRYFLVDVK